MTTSESIKTLHEALCKAQTELEGAEINSDNTFHKSRYANLEAVIRATKIIHKHGLSFTQVGTVIDNSYYLVTRLMHNSGEWLEGVYPVKAEQDPQKVKSAHTYARRASLMAILGMSESDDDGNDASDKAKSPISPKVESKPQTPPKPPPNVHGSTTGPIAPKGWALSQPQIKRLYAIAHKAGLNEETVRKTVMERYSVDPSKMSKAQYDTLCSEMEQMIGDLK